MPRTGTHTKCKRGALGGTHTDRTRTGTDTKEGPKAVVAAEVRGHNPPPYAGGHGVSV